MSDGPHPGCLDPILNFVFIVVGLTYLILKGRKP